MQNLRIIHTADWHLGNPYSNYPPSLSRGLRRQAFLALAELKEYIKNQGCDLLIFAGDTFHYPLARSEDIAEFDNFLQEVQAPYVIVLPGNHDPYFKSSTWSKIKAFANPRRILIAEDHDYYDLDDLTCRIFAKSFKTRQGREHFFSADLKSRSDYFNLYIAHGELVQKNETSLYQPIPRAYLAAQEIDVALLGHIHKRQIEYLAPHQLPVIYPGSPQGLSWSELGLRGVESIELKRIPGLKRRSFKHEFIALSGTRFFERSINLESLLKDMNLDRKKRLDPGMLANAIQEIISSWDDFANERDFLRLELTGLIKADLPLVQLEGYLKNNFLSIDLVNHCQIEIDPEELYKSESFIAALYQEKEKLINESSSPAEREVIESAWRLLRQKHGAHK